MTRVPKILMLVENNPVPIDRRVWPEATILRDAGFQVSIICPKGTTAYRESYICIDNIHIYRYQLPTFTNKYFGYIAEYFVALLMTYCLSFKVLFRHGFDIIHSANPPDLFFTIALFYRLFGKKFIFDQHDLAPEMFKIKFKERMKPLYKLQLLMERYSYRTAHLIITSNVSQRRFAIERGLCSTDKVYVVRNGSGLTITQLTAPEPELKNRRRYVLAYEGIMSVQDGVEYTLYALHSLIYKRGRRDVSLLLIGDGDSASALHELAHELQLDEYVDFTGWIERKDIVRYLAVADVGLVPDPQNGLNEYCTMIKTMDYMAMGKPIVAFDLIETRFSSQDAALYATPNIVEDFANNIETLLNDEQLRFQMSKIGRKRIEEELGWDHSRKDLLLAYKTLYLKDFEHDNRCKFPIER